MKIYAMRHGQTTYNLLGLCNDDPRDEVPLTELGIRQAEEAAVTLKDAALERIFVSELPRTRQTAEIINRHHGVPIAAHPGLNDIRSGFNNRPVAEYFAATGHDRLHLRVNGGESLLDYQARVLAFLDWLRPQPWQEVLVVAHEETLRVLAARFRGLPDAALPGLAFGNCEILRFET
jgi:broad specificity phosphatase PhoE